MKYISIAALTLFGALTGSGQMLCHDESVCTPMGGCRWVAVCSGNSRARAAAYADRPNANHSDAGALSGAASVPR